MANSNWLPQVVEQLFCKIRKPATVVFTLYGESVDEVFSRLPKMHEPWPGTELFPSSIGVERLEEREDVFRVTVEFEDSK